MVLVAKRILETLRKQIKVRPDTKNHTISPRTFKFVLRHPGYSFSPGEETQRSVT